MRRQSKSIFQLYFVFTIMVWFVTLVSAQTQKLVVVSWNLESGESSNTFIANRVKKNTVVYDALEKFLNSLKLPFLTTLRDTQIYVRAASRGVGVYEMWDERVHHNQVDWQPVVAWLEGLAVQKEQARQGNQPTSIALPAAVSTTFTG